MKKVILPAIVLATALFASCGPNAEELAKKAQATADSIANAELQLHLEDSLAAVASMEAAKATALTDSLSKVAEQVKADSIANAAKGVKNTVKKVVNSVVKGTNGRDSDQKLNNNVKGSDGRDGDQKLNTTVKGTQGRG